MATSGTTTFSVNELDIYKDALQNLGLIGAGETPSADDVAACRHRLNLLVKQWVAQMDFAPGLKMWTRRRAYVFLQDGQIEYDIPGDRATESYTTELVTVAAAAAATAVTTTTTMTGIIGVELDDGSLQWFTGTTAALGAALTDTVSVGNRVFAYTTALARKPHEIVTASLRSHDDDETSDAPMDPNLSLEEYECIPNKAGIGQPWQIYYEPKLTATTLYLNCAPADVTQVIRLVYLSSIEDLTASTGDIDLPQEWYRPLAAQLAMDLAPVFQVKVTPELKLARDESLKMAQHAYPSKSIAYFQSDPDDY
jgi:hypothetical protein